jgi:hypothetical protein
MVETPRMLLITTCLGAIFTLMCVASWWAYFFGDGDGERAAFCSAVGVFAAPLWAGSVLALRGDRRGRRLLRFGAAPLVLEPSLFMAIWTLADSPEYQRYVWSLPPRKPTPDDPPA